METVAVWDQAEEWEAPMMRSNHIPDSSEILTVPEVATRLRVASSWVYEHADSLGAYRLGKYLRFNWRRVLERLEAGETRENGFGSGAAAQRPTTERVNSRT